MEDEYYEKRLIGRWYDERLKETIDVSAVTYEKLREPKREKALGMALLSNHPNAGDFHYWDEFSVKFEEGIPVYPDVDVETRTRIGIIDKHDTKR